MDVMGYLSRIGLSEPVTTDLMGLDRLIQAHLTHVPFEALEVWGTGAVPSLEIPELYKKIVGNRRGGYCFELNSLFCCLLNTIGFEAYLVTASLLNEAGEAAPPAHSAIVCTLNGQKYFADVGFGGPVPYGALPLKEGESMGFRLEKKGGFYVLKKISEEGESFLLRFRDVPTEPVELIPLNFYISQKPDIHFRNRLLVSLRRADGTVWTLKGKTLQIRRGGIGEEYPVEDGDTLETLLGERFGIDPRVLPFSLKRRWAEE